MPKAKNQKSGGNKKCGRDSLKCQRYLALKIREKNKLKRVLQSNGVAAATSYAAEHNLSGYLSDMVRQRVQRSV